MAEETAIFKELGGDAELLLASDAWLENQRLRLQQKMSIMADELSDILTAQKIKTSLQQRNMVAVRCVEKDKVGQPRDIVIKICPVGEAANRLDNEATDKSIPPDISRENRQQHLDVWRMDGYDVEASRDLFREHASDN